MKASIRHFYNPTPAKLRKLGDALLASATFVTSLAIVQNYKTVALVAVIVGAVGKFITNFFTEDK